MAKKNSKVKENEELKENVVTETAKNEEVEENKKETKTKTANTSFNDKYTGTKYEKGTEFVVVKEDVETTKIDDKKYKISEKRAEEIKAKGYID